MHVTTTPGVSYVASTEDFDCGIMISASQNPYYDNSISEMSDIPAARKDQISYSVDYVAGRNRYVGYRVSLATCFYKGKRIGLDCSNGLNINEKCGFTHIEVL